jgi:anti-sigma regulatory factor (Ser/Thr protein kinase)
MSLRTSVMTCAAAELDLRVPAMPAIIGAVTEEVMGFLADQEGSEDDLVAVELALQEALANGVRHGCKGDPSKHVHCLVTCNASGELLIVVRDDGPGFDATALPDPLEPANLLNASGRGVFLINRLMDDVAFADGGREVRMRKRLTHRTAN